jgi:hypothetical protein
VKDESMQLGIGKTVFPAWAASLTLVKDHGTEAVEHAAAAIRATTGSTRLDAAVRAMTSFDHAIDNTRNLPVQWFLRSAPLYYRGYEAAKQAVNLLVASGLIPGARERVGRQSLLAAKDTFLAGVDVARADRSRYGAHLASGWLDATAEDALTGAGMLHPGDEAGRALLAGINQVRGAVLAKRALDPAVVQAVTDLFDRVGSQFDAAISAAEATRGIDVGEVDPTAFNRSGTLLEQAELAARQLVADAPDESVFDSMRHAV